MRGQRGQENQKMSLNINKNYNFHHDFLIKFPNSNPYWSKSSIKPAAVIQSNNNQIASKSSKLIDVSLYIIYILTHQFPTLNHIRKSIAGLGIRQNMKIGALVTLHSYNLVNFIQLLNNTLLPILPEKNLPHIVNNEQINLGIINIHNMSFLFEGLPNKDRLHSSWGINMQMKVFKPKSNKVQNYKEKFLFVSSFLISFII